MNEEIYGRSVLQKYTYGPDESIIDFMFNPYATDSFCEKLNQKIKDYRKNNKEEFEMDYLEGSFVIEKQDKGFVIEIATEYNCKVLVSESYHMYQAVEKMPEAMVMIIDDIKAEMKRQEKIRMAKEVLEEEGTE